MAIKKPVAKKVAAKKVAAKKGISKKQSYIALENVQRTDTPKLKFYLFHASASEIFQWGLIDRMSPESPKAIQRRLNKTKILRIEEFLAYPGNTIATSVVVVFNKSAISYKEGKPSSAGDSAFGRLEVSWTAKEAAGIIVDGQHRVIGAHAYGKDIRLNVVGIVGADDTEGAFQFLVINNNSSKVSPSQVKALFTSYKEEALLKRMLDSGSTNIDSEKITALDYFDGGSDSPFKGQLKWAKNAKGTIAPNALEAGLGEVQNRSALLAIGELELDTFTVIWSTIKKTWPALWNEESHLLEKACLQALTAYICNSLENFRSHSDEGVDYSDPKVVAREVVKVLNKLETSFFEVQWGTTGLDTRAGQELLLTDLKRMAANLKSGATWHDGLELVNIGAVSGGQIKKGARPSKVKQ